MLDAEIRELTERMLNGEIDLADEIIKMHLVLSKKIAYRWIRAHPQVEDDLLSVAALGVVTAVRWACDGRLKDFNISPYITRTVIRFITEFLERDHLIRVPRDAFREMVKQDDFEAIMYVYTDSRDRSRINSSIKHPYDTMGAHWYEDRCKHDPSIDVFPAIDNLQYEDILAALNLTERERNILEMRLDGHSFLEVGAAIGFSDVGVIKMLGRIKDRYERIKKTL